MDKLKQVLFQRLDHAEICVDYWEELADRRDSLEWKYRDYVSRWRFVVEYIRIVLKAAGIENEYEEWRNSDA